MDDKPRRTGTSGHSTDKNREFMREALAKSTQNARDTHIRRPERPQSRMRSERTSLSSERLSARQTPSSRTVKPNTNTQAVPTVQPKKAVPAVQPKKAVPTVQPKKTESPISKKDKKKKKKKGFRVFLLVFFLAFLSAGLGAYLGIIKGAPSLDVIAVEPDVYTSIVYDSDGTEIDRFHGDENREYVTLANIPQYMQDAIISVEDSRFYKHNGIDARGIARALYTTIKNKLTKKTGLEGASTITQQLIKNNVAKRTRNNIVSKLQEQYLAVKYEKMLTKELGSKKAAKDYILELYLNTIGLHHGYSGVQSASLGYFGKDVSELNLAECACIAGITNNPSRYSPRTNPENNKERQKKILSDMLSQGYITQEEMDNALADDIYSRITENTTEIEQKAQEGSVVHSFFIDSLFEQISSDLQTQYNMSSAQANNLLYNGGLQITATIDTNMQKIVDETYLNADMFPDSDYKLDAVYTVSVQDMDTGKQTNSEFKQFVKSQEEADAFAASKKTEILASLEGNQEITAEKTTLTVQPQSAMIIMDYRTGEIKALAGGRGEKTVNRGFNRAVDSARQPGSVFKVLASFAPGIDMGKLTPATVEDDVPYSVGDYSPSNWYTNPPYRGLSTIREGVRDSMNIVAVKAMVNSGVDACYNYLLNLGFTTLEDDNHAAAALGGLKNGVTQLEVTAAYGAIANGGVYNRPMFYSKVLDHDGNVLLENNLENKRVFKQTTAFLVTDMMRDVVKSGTGTKAAFVNSAMPVSGKTGTSQESRDLTFVGFTPYYVAGVWLGYDRYDDTVNNMSDMDQSAHLVLWRTIMEKIHSGLEVKEFTKPDGIVTAEICTESGYLAAKLCNRDPRGTIRTEYFSSENVPTEYCNVHKTVTICSSSDMLFGKYCPDSCEETISGIVRPQPYNGDEEIGDRKYEVGAMGYCDVHTSYRSYSNNSYDNDDSDTDYSDNDNDSDDESYSNSSDDDNSSSEQSNQGSTGSTEENRHETVTEAPAPSQPETPEPVADDPILGSVIPSTPSEPVMPE